MKTKKRVLVCEDDPVQLAILAAALGQAGFETATARTADEGLRAAPVDAVVSDIHLKRGDAFDLLAGLRRAGRDCPTLMISGSATPLLKERAIRAGVRGLIEKPCDIPSIVRVVRGLVESKPEAAPLPILLPRPEIVGRADGQAPSADSAPPPVRRVGVLAAPPQAAPSETRPWSLRIGLWAAAVGAALALGLLGAL
jgi:DNA-binding response OmpR family regulator